MTPPEPFSPRHRPRIAEAGFSLLELLIAMVVMAEVMAAILLLFTSLSDIARVQTDVAEMQQTQRVGQRSMIEITREAGLGGLPMDDGQVVPPPADLFPGIAMTVRNDTPANGRIAGGGSDLVLPGSDVLVVRGVFSTPVYYLTPQLPTRVAGNAAASLLDGAASPFTLSNETLRIPEKISPFDAVSQSLQPLIDALTADPQRVLIVRDLLNPGAYALIETAGIASDLATCGGCIIVNVNLTNATDAPLYVALMNGSGIPGNAGFQVQIGGGPGVTVAFPRLIGAIGMLQEYRYYLRPDPNFDPLDPDEDNTLLLADSTQRLPVMRLSRIEVRPGTDNVIGQPIDIADNLLDLQLAIGFDTSPDCPPSCSAAARLQRGLIFEDGSDNDEVVFNDADDVFNGFAEGPGGRPVTHFLRITSMVHAPRPERGYSATPVTFIEDEDRSQSVTLAGVTFNYNTSLAQYRRRIMSTVIDLRNER